MTDLDLRLPPFGHAFTIPVDPSRLNEFMEWLRLHCVIVTEAEYTGLRARLAEALERIKELEKDRGP